MHDDIAYLSATALVEHYRGGELSPVEVVRALRERAEALNPDLGAIATPIPDAEERAALAEAALRRGDATGPLVGVPFTIKDSFDTAGVRTTRGSLLFADHVPAADATVVRRLAEAGAIPLAKTNLPDFALWWETDSRVFGRTVNPWDPARSAGGSSGGEAAAIAAGLSPLGVGSDLGGSVRLPAAYCGVFGLKPTHGRVPVTGHWPETLLRFMHTGFLARSPADIAVALSVTAGPDGEDPYAMPLPAPAATVPPLRAAVRVGIVTDAFGPIEPEVVEAVEQAGAALAAHGCVVTRAKVPALADCDWNTTTMLLYGGGAGAYFERVVAGRHDQLHRALASRLAKRVESLADYVAAEEAVEELRRGVARFFLGHDLLLCATVPAAAHGHDAEEVRIDGERYPPRTTMRATIPWDLTGSPAMSVPYAHSAEGMPLGIQLIGRPFDEEVVLGASSVLVPGEIRRPPDRPRQATS